MLHQETSASCQNCAATLSGPYCSACGQKTGHLHRPIWEIAEDFLHTVVHFDGRLWQTLRSLFLHPGQMSEDWADGRQARYVPPIRLFIFTSLILVSILTLSDVSLMRLAPLSHNLLPTDHATDENAAIGRELVLLDVVPKDSPALPPIERLEDEGVPEVSQNFIDGINALARDPHLSNQTIGKSLSRFMLLAVPVMALSLWLCYLRRKRYLAEHMVFALNVHTFFFICLLLAVLLVWISRGLISGGWLLAALWLSYSVHFLLALKRMYQQSWLKTAIKSALITGLYAAALLGVSVYLLVKAMIP